MNRSGRSNGAAFCQLVSVTFAGLVAGIVAWLCVVGYRFIIEVPASAISHDSGFAYQIDPQALKRGVLIGEGDSNDAPTKSTAIVQEGTALRLGPAHTLHKEIRNLGGGRFSHWGEHIIFSASDNTDPRVNHRKYIVEISLYLPFYYGLLAGAVFGGIIVVSRHELARITHLLAESVGVYQGVLQRSWKMVTRNRVVRWTRENIVPPLLGTLVVFSALVMIGEAYFRITTPFTELRWPSKFDPKIGFIFQPNAELRYTNYLDFWVSEHINSLGFADREPKSAASPRSCQVVFIGDSMVEAAQVRNDQKVQAILEKKAAAVHPEWHLTSSAFGFSGTGQLNQLTFYDSFVHHLRPQLVVLVFAGNDFANNSSLLEALRNGWHPDHPPRLFARHDRVTGNYRWIPIDPHWQRYFLQTRTRSNHNHPIQRTLHSVMKKHSLFYGWLWRKLAPLYPELVSRLEGELTLPELIAMRVELLREMDGYRWQVRNWDHSYDSDLDALFYDENLPELFSDALNLTGFALSEFQRRVKQDKGTLVILTTSQMSLPRVSRPGHKNDPLISRRQFLRLESIARYLEIPIIDQYEYIVRNGGDLLAAQFKHDAHWTPQGHIWAAEAILKYLDQNPRICHSE